MQTSSLELMAEKLQALADQGETKLSKQLDETRRRSLKRLVSSYQQTDLMTMEVDGGSQAALPLPDLGNLVNMVSGAAVILRRLARLGIEGLRRLLPNQIRPIMEELFFLADLLDVPMVVITVDDRTAAVNETKRFTARYSLDLGEDKFDWYVDNALLQSEKTGNFTHAFSKVGSYKVRAEVARTESTTVADEMEMVVSVQTAEDLVVDIDVNPTNPKVGQRVIFTPIVQGASDDEDYAFDWDFGDHSTHSMDAKPTHLYAAVGEYPVTVIVSRSMGETRDVQRAERRKQLNVRAADPQSVLTISAVPSNPKVGEVVRFSFSGREIGAPVWDFGDGNQSREISPQHPYSKEGSYTVTLNDSGIVPGTPATLALTVSAIPTQVNKTSLVMFEELRQREEAVWQANRERLQTLQRRKDEDKYLHPSLQNELNELIALFPQFANGNLYPHSAPDPSDNPQDGTGEAQRLLKMQDPMFAAIIATLRGTDVNTFTPQWHLVGLFASQLSNQPQSPHLPGETMVAAIYGILLRERITDPQQERRFQNALAQARGEYGTYFALFDRVLSVLIDEGQFTVQSPGRPNDPNLLCLPDEIWVPNPAFALLSQNRTALRKVSLERWAAVVKLLVQDGVTPNTVNLDLQIRQTLQSLSGRDDNAAPSAMDIDLPDLEQQVDVEIIIENVMAMQAIFFSATLEELRLFQVRDKLLEMFQSGMLPVVRGRAGDLLYRQMRKSVSRLSEYDRRNLYARTLGFAGGDASNSPNRDFQMLWLRFVSAVSSFARQLRVDSLLRADVPARVHQEQVRKSARDLAANLSLFGYGMAYFAATELQTEINEIIELLSDSEIKGAYGARDMWGVIDQIGTLELGGARDSVRYRTMASSGAVIIAWLARNHERLTSIGNQVLDMNEIARPNIRPKGEKITQNPYDSDLVNACEQWITVTGTQEEQIEELSGASISPITPSRPIQIPSIARDMLESVGFRYNGR